MQAIRAVVRGNGVRSFATQAMKPLSYTVMNQSKHDFVHFANEAVKSGTAERKEMYKYLNKCFTDSDTDYDGLVSYRGFNSMVEEAALAPRRFGFAPQNFEMYSSKEELTLKRTELFKKLAAMSGAGTKHGQERVSMEAWMSWAMAHVKEKVGPGLAEHETSKWERSKAECIEFHKKVALQGSTHNRKSTTSTQFKEFYMLQNDLFIEANKSLTGCLNKEEFGEMVKLANAIPMKFDMNWYSGANFDKVATNGKVGWKAWKEYALQVVIEQANKA